MVEFFYAFIMVNGILLVLEKIIDEIL